jgi:tetratricopeptide (TPR) repeat protein
MQLADHLRELEAVRNNPALLLLATIDVVHPEQSEEARKRLKDALLVAAVPHWCDAAFLASLLDVAINAAELVFRDLGTLQVTEPFPARGKNAINVHESARLTLREHLRTAAPERWKALSLRAIGHLQGTTEPHSRIEALYHLFAVDQAEAAIECERLDRELSDGRWDSRHALSLSLQELNAAHWLEGAASVEARIVPLRIALDRGEAASQSGEARNILALARMASPPARIAEAELLLGCVLETQGQLGDALPAFERSESILLQLTREGQPNSGWQRDLIAVSAKVGDVHQEQGRLEDALGRFRRSLAISERLATSDPSNASWQRDLGVALSRVGDVQQSQGRLDEALDSFRRDLAISERLATSDPSNAGWQRDLAIALSKVGNVQQAQGCLDEALDSFRRSLAISERLAISDPSNASWQRGLAGALFRVGNVQQAQGRIDEALDSFRRDLAISERLAISDPSNAGWQRDLAVTLSRVGDVQQAQGRIDEALDSFRCYLAIFERLAISDPSNAGWQREIALVLSRIGSLHAAQGQHSEALASFQRAMEATARLASS